MIAIILLIFFLFIIELFYFRIADQFMIIDRPNERSSHTLNTIRGGGIIFPIAWSISFFCNGFHYPWFTLGLVLVSLVSFWDDVQPLNNGIRLLTHLVGFAFCFHELGLWQIYPLWTLLLLMILSIGTLNVINFMDGINGMTGLYALSVFLPLLWFWNSATSITLQNPWWIIVLSVLVFGFFNFRKKARCFAGDIGSVSLGYLLIFFLLGLIFNRWSPDFQSLKHHSVTGNFEFKYVLLLSVYGVDGFMTIIQRLFQRENIFKAHRSHLYQLLVNEKQWPHLNVALLYACLQLMISVWVIFFYIHHYQGIVLISVLCLFYIILKKEVNFTK